MFPTSKDILRQKEVIIFACGLMTDATSLVGHIYQTCQRKDPRNILQSTFSSKELESFHALYMESKTLLEGNYVHNQHINYFDHKSDERNCQLLDTQMYSRSKEYIFLDMTTKVDEVKQKKPDDLDECSIHIDNSGSNSVPEIIKHLVTTCRDISELQPIVRLYLRNLNFENFGESKIFSMSSKATSVEIYFCSLPSQVNIDLQQQLSECKELEVISFCGTRIEDTTFLNRLKSMSSLTCLELVETEISPTIGGEVCKQMKDLKSLHVLRLSIPGLGEYGHYICRSLEAWGPNSSLQILYLRNCDMPADVCSAIIPHVPKNVTLLHLSENTLTGCLSKFMKLPKLSFLALSRGSLILNDIEHLTHLICDNKFPCLADLYLSQNNLDKICIALTNLMKELIVHHYKDLSITLERNKLSIQIQEDLKKLCKDKNVYLVFASYS